MPTATAHQPFQPPPPHPATSWRPASQIMRPKKRQHAQWKPAPPTDPEQICALWTTVRTMSGSSSSSIPVRATDVRAGVSRARSGRGTQAGRAGRGSRNIGAEIPPSPPASAPNLDTDSISISETVHTNDSKNTARSKKKIVGPRDPGFAERVLEPHGICVDRTIPYGCNLADLFGEAPPEGYSQTTALEHLKLWLDTDDDFLGRIVHEYKAMTDRNLCEDEYASFAKEELLKATRRAGRCPNDARLRVERMLGPSIIPNSNSHWKKPPVCQDRTDPEWAWDLRPDCTYWLSIVGFNPSWRHRVNGIVYVNDVVALPYFTVEFKRDDESSIDVAINQVAAAGAIALYNRFLLHQKAVRWKSDIADEELNWTPTPISRLMHFGLTFVGSQFRIWMLKPTIDSDTGEWRGCSMEGLVNAKCKEGLAATRELVDCINEIHRWGVMVHGRDCKDEIKVCLKARGMRVSEVGGDERR